VRGWFGLTGRDHFFAVSLRSGVSMAALRHNGARPTEARLSRAARCYRNKPVALGSGLREPSYDSGAD